MDYTKACGLLKPVESSQLAAMGYCPEEGRLVIQFKPRKSDPPGTPGPIYHYPHTAEEWAACEAAPSKGSYLIGIKKNVGKWPHTKLEAPEPAEEVRF